MIAFTWSSRQIARSFKSSIKQKRRGRAAFAAVLSQGQAMPRQENIPHGENVQLVQESRSHGGAPGFNFHFNIVLIVALSFVILLSYLVFS